MSELSLREEIAEIVRQMRPAAERADAILAIPRLQEALRVKGIVDEAVRVELGAPATAP